MPRQHGVVRLVNRPLYYQMTLNTALIGLRRQLD